MVFSSIEFGLFFVAVMVAYVMTIQKYRWAVLLSGSFVFYAGLNALYLPATLIVILIVTYLFGNWIYGAADEKKKRTLLWIGILLILAIFASIRYLSFFYRLFYIPRGVSGTADFMRHPIILTVGISFIAFQAISYLVDIVRGVCNNERHIGYLALYLAYFPKLLQGPLEHAEVIIPQLRETRINNYENIRSGIVLFAWGLCKKVIIADRMAVIVNQVFENVKYYHGFSLIIAIYAFAIQIYADFSGYTDMAIGISRIFNISLTENFKHPYFSISFAEFWRRWHISFMNWLREYLFMPLQIIWREQKTLGSVVAILIIFAISGLWHGVGYTFVIWGLLNGIFVAGGLIFEKLRGKLKWKKHENAVKNFLKMIVVFNLTCLSWIFFRSKSVQDAIYIIGHMTNGIRAQIVSFEVFERAILIGMKRPQAALTGILVLIFCFVEGILYRKKCKFDELVTKTYFKIRWPIYFSIISGIILFSYKESGGFIYFSF